MAIKTADRVAETTVTTGTGTLSLAGAKSGFQSFVAGIGNGVKCYYSLTDETSNWEVGIGTVTSGTPNTLSRTTVLASSNANALVNFGAGTKDVFCTAPAAKLLLADDTPQHLLATDGSVAHPILAFANDLNTGLARIASNSMSLVARNAEVVRATAAASALGFLIATAPASAGDFSLAISNDTACNLALVPGSGANVLLGGLAGAESVRVPVVASAVRAIKLLGATSGNNPTIDVTGGSLAITPAAVFASTISCGEVITASGQLNLQPANGVVNIGSQTGRNSYALEISGTGNASTMRITDATAGNTTGFIIQQLSNGAAGVNNQFNNILFFGANNQTQVQVVNTSGTIDRVLTLQGGASGSGSVATVGTTSSSLALTANSGTVALAAAPGAEALRALNVASAVNRIEVSGAVTSANPTLAFTGSDSNVSASFQVKGAGGYNFLLSGGANILQVVASSTSDSARVVLTSSTTNPSVAASANNLLFGSGSALATNATAGMIAIPACAGAPTGSPTGAGLGAITLVYDTTDEKLYRHNGTNWKSTAAFT